MGPKSAFFAAPKWPKTKHGRADLMLKIVPFARAIHMIKTVAKWIAFLFWQGLGLVFTLALLVVFWISFVVLWLWDCLTLRKFRAKEP